MFSAHNRIKLQLNSSLKKILKLLETKQHSNPDTVAHTCNPSHLGGTDRKTMVRGQPGQKVSKILSQRTSLARWQRPVIPLHYTEA
jgi:hypothetical protein